MLKMRYSTVSAPRLRKSPKYSIQLLIVAAFIILFVQTIHATTYYVNCSSSSNGTGTQSNPWNSVASVNSATLNAGDEILFMRGTTCMGELNPNGAGTSAAPNTINAYGTGALPILSDSTDDEVVLLFNQQYWEINNLQIVGGIHHGVYVTGNGTTTLNHLYFTNIDLSGASFVSASRGDSGELIILPDGAGETLNDVVINGVTAHDSTVSEGVLVGAGGKVVSNYLDQALGTNITIENSTVYNIYGDGILLTDVASGGLLENNVVHSTGMSPTSLGSTPSGLWEFYCIGCVIQNNESYSNQTYASGDGGDYDIDEYNSNNIVQYNYGHDSAGYCVLYIAENSAANTNDIFRYNVCANDQQNNYIKSNTGEIFFYTSGGGSIDGAQIYNNTFFWNPATNGALLDTTLASFSGSNPNIFENNIIYSTVADMVNATSSMTLNNNIYWIAGGVAPSWEYGGTTYTSFSSYQSGTGQDANGIYADPMLNQVGYQSAGRPSTAYTLQPGSPAVGSGTVISNNGGLDFFGNSVSATASPNIGAYNGSGITPGNLVSNPGFESGSLGAWTDSNSAVVNSNVHTGEYALRVTGAGSSQQTITGLSPNTTYTFGGWGEVVTSGDDVYLGVKDYNGSAEVETPISVTSYSYAHVTFTTGPSVTEATVFFYHPASTGTTYGDDFSLVTDLVANPGLETGSLSPWTGGYASVVTSPVHSGSYAVQVVPTGSAEQVISGLVADTDYVLQGYAAVQTSGTTVEIGVNSYGGSQPESLITSTSYTPAAVDFTTGATNTTATIFFYQPSGSGDSYGDDFSVFHNMLTDSGLEWGSVGPWQPSSSSVKVVPGEAQSGTYALQLTGSGTIANQVVAGLAPNTAYTLSGWVKAGSGVTAELGVKNYGGSTIYSSMTSTSYTWASVTFTTGDSDTTADIFFTVASGSGNAYGDSFALAPSTE